MNTQTALRAAKRRLGASPLGHLGKVAVTQRGARTLALPDPTLQAVLGALVAPAAGEHEWITRIERTRRELSDSTRTVLHDVDDLEYWRGAIARSQHRHPPVLVDETHVRRTVGEIADQTSKPADWGLLFFRVVRALRPQRCLEMGTSVGMSACYLAGGLQANGSGRLITLEGQQGSADVAREALAGVGVADRAEVRVGWFDDTLGDALTSLGGIDMAFIDGNHKYQPTIDYFEAIAPITSAGGLLIFDDVDFWTGDMAKAWTQIQADPRVTGTLTLEGVGLAVLGGRRTGDYEIGRLGLRGARR